MARWHIDAGERSAERPQQQLTLKELVVVAPQYPGPQALRHQDEEVAFLSRLKGYRRSPGTSQGLRQLAEKPPAGIVHFAGHGELAGAGPTQRRYLLRLEDAKLDAVQWRGLPRPAVPVSSLYFFNACDAGMVESQVDSVSGWAPTLLDAGAGGFIGGLWALHDGPASRFAMRFYAELRQGEDRNDRERPSIAEALRRARSLFFDTGDPTFLAYVYYGDVNLELTDAQ